MSEQLLILISLIYLLLLFGFAFFFRKRKYFSSSKYAYALSICVYCTAWTFYGSIGRAVSTGFGYLGVYLGPTIIAPLLFLSLTKTIKISKYLKISSLADFISARYGKSTAIGTLVTVLCILIVIPYISIQLKAINLSFNLLAHFPSDMSSNKINNIFVDPALYFGIFCAFISSFFGTVKPAPSDRHPGITTVIAAESLIKLAAFLIGAIFIIYYLNSGVSSIFKNYKDLGIQSELLYIESLSKTGNQWFWISFISAFAFILLPRQFHMSVIENNKVSHVKFASWFVPLYLFAISIFVIPIAFSGIIKFGDTVIPDNYFATLLLSEDIYSIAIIVFIGGISASTGMIVASLISLSIMMSNYILLPSLLKFNSINIIKLEDQVIQFRRLLIFVILILSYLFYRYYSVNYSLVSIGLISFVGICQLIPSYFLGLYWKFTNSKGAISGLVAGMIIWAYTLPVVNLCEIGILDSSLMENGLLGIEFLKPQALFGISNMDPISLSSFLSLTINIGVTCLVSLSTNRKPLEISQSDIYLYPDKYIKNDQPAVLSSQAKFSEIKNVLSEIIGKRKVKVLLDNYLKINNMVAFEENADTALVQYIEKHLTGSLGSAGARLILHNIVKHEPVKPEQLFKVLDEANQLFEYSKELEIKRDELNLKTDQLFEANNKLMELDQLKNEFISNITHELRTPLTSIQSLADSLNRYDLDENEKAQVINIIKKESDRISSLVNQVLDLRKLESLEELELEPFFLNQIIDEVVAILTDKTENRSLLVNCPKIELYSDQNKLKQVILNIIANSIKFTNSHDGQISIDVHENKEAIIIEIIDNGKGIPKEDLPFIFDRFFQANNIKKLNLVGTGLGLSICKHLIEVLKGTIEVKSIENRWTKFTLKLKDYK